MEFQLCLPVVNCVSYDKIINALAPIVRFMILIKEKWRETFGRFLF